MYEIFKIILKPKKIDVEKSLEKLPSLNWYPVDHKIVKDDDGLKYVIDLASFELKCMLGELFPIEIGEWLPKDYPSREELVNSAIGELKKLPFSLEVDRIQRVVKHELA
ncbi:MAG: hypothetical protein NWE98_08280 [Candidatus Bathyarchaeota archaeon]|nr:hypothetical protein [Candidatus Bathyarchaeota archaeon]